MNPNQDYVAFEQSSNNSQRFTTFTSESRKNKEFSRVHTRNIRLRRTTRRDTLETNRVETPATSSYYVFFHSLYSSTICYSTFYYACIALDRDNKIYYSRSFIRK